MENDDYIIIPETRKIADPNVRIIELLTYNRELHNQTVNNKAINIALKASSTAQQAAVKAQYMVMEAVVKSRCALLKVQHDNLNAVNRACHAAMKAAHDANISASNAAHATSIFKLRQAKLSQNTKFKEQINLLKKRIDSSKRTLSGVYQRQAKKQK